jgi:hypothetical protein
VKYSIIEKISSSKEPNYANWRGYKVIGFNKSLPDTLSAKFQINKDSIIVEINTENIAQDYPIGSSDNDDYDGDGVKNEDDKCPNKKGPKNNKGCPKVSNNPLEEEEAAVQAAKSELQRLVKKYNKKGSELDDETKDCNDCSTESEKEKCNDEIKPARQNYTTAKEKLNQAKLRNDIQ